MEVIQLPEKHNLQLTYSAFFNPNRHQKSGCKSVYSSLKNTRLLKEAQLEMSAALLKKTPSFDTTETAQNVYCSP